ncbi:DUF2550 family protein [Jatrophihabitans sp. DSM 45814]
MCLFGLCAIAAFVLVVLHQRRMVSSVGSLAVALKRGDQRWANGVGRYAGDEFVWYRTLSLSPTAAMRMPRSELSVVSNRAWDASRDMALRPNLSIVECSFRGESISLGFPDSGLTGFLSWLEASAPRF